MLLLHFLLAIFCLTCVSGTYVLEERYRQRNCTGASQVYTIRKTNDADKMFRQENIIDQSKYRNNTFLDDMFDNVVHIRNLPDPSNGRRFCFFSGYTLRGVADTVIEDPETRCQFQHYPVPIGTKCLITLGSPGKCKP